MMITTKTASKALMVLAALCCMVGAASAATFGDFTYTDNGTSITITDYPTSATGAVDVPSTIIRKPVTSIGSQALSGCSNLTAISVDALNPNNHPPDADCSAYSSLLGWE
jgi:hypothetical protein